MNTRFQVTGVIVVLVVATTGMYLWLAAKAKRDAAAPAGAEIIATVPGEGAARVAAGGESTLAAADIGTAAADLSRAAAAPVLNLPRTRLGGELAIQWAQVATGYPSRRIEDERSQRAARDSIAFATPFEIQERFDAEVQAASPTCIPLQRPHRLDGNATSDGVHDTLPDKRRLSGPQPVFTQVCGTPV